MDTRVFITEAEKDYELLDSGEGEKLERYGKIILSRPDPQALWKKTLPESEWKKAQAHFDTSGKKGSWIMNEKLPPRWSIDFAGLKFWIKPSSFKHTGLFPEQSSNWQWMQEKIKTAGKPVKVLNLFGYTGGATLAALRAGAEAVHVDGSKVAVTWARENCEISGLKEKPIRWILDDALAFVEREARRGNAYDAIIMDPPAFGRGPEGEVWKIEEKFLPLLEACKKILSKEPVFIIINGYASGYSPIAYRNALFDTFGGAGKIEAGELAIKQTHGDHLLPAGITARWSKN